MASTRLSGRAATTGGGAGTLLLIVAEHLSPSNAWLKPYLLYGAPTASMLTAWAWLIIADGAERVQEWLNVTFFLWGKRRLRNKELRDRNSTPEHKEDVKEIYERYSKAAMTLKYAQLKDLKIKLTP